MTKYKIKLTSIKAKRKRLVIIYIIRLRRIKLDKKIEQLIEIAKQHPEKEIVCMVQNEVCSSDDHRYWQCEIKNIVVDLYYCPD